MKSLDFQKQYRQAVKRLNKLYGSKNAMEKAPGGDFDAVGILERELLIQHGLRTTDYLIDVGCGSGRLAKPLSEYLDGKYLGTEIVPAVVKHARKLVNRKDWSFLVTDGFTIPEENEQADVICFFSVFTHLLHEHSYQYLVEAKRVLKTNGKIIFSFLEYKIPAHWHHFNMKLSDTNEQLPLIVFMSRDCIEAWADHLCLKILAIIDGDKPHIPLSHPVTFDDGSTVEGEGKLGPIGQSVCILTK